MARRLNIGFDKGPATLVAQTGKYGLLRPNVSFVRAGGLTPARVWAPGHWVDAGSGVIDATTVKPNILGVMIRKPWNTLEPGSAGTYTLSAIGTQLNTAASLGIYLMLMIEVKSFSLVNPPSADKQFAPPYLVPYSTFYTNMLGACGYSMWRWDDHVYLAYQDLVNAVGAYVAAHPNKARFAGIATQETSTQAAGDDPTYTAQRYIDALKLESDYITAGCLTGRGYHYVNQIPQNGNGSLLPQLYNKIRTNGGCYGFPDLTMGNSGLNNNVYTWVLNAHNLGGATFSSVQNAEFQPKPPADDRTMLTLYKYSVASTATITGATRANPIVFTASAQGWASGMRILFASLPGDFGTNINGTYRVITVIDATHFSVPVNGTAYAAYTSGGIGKVADDFGEQPIHNDMIFWTPHQSGARNYNPEAVAVIAANPGPFGSVTPIDP